VGVIPTWQSEDGSAVLYRADNRDVLPTLVGIDCIVTDPPYGCKADCDYTRFTKKTRSYLTDNNTWPGIVGDDAPFDPSPWLNYPEVILWGYQHFAAILPVGTVLVWLKRNEAAFGSFLSDAELAWQKGGTGCYVHACEWSGFKRLAIGEPSMHPTQKPTDLMRWCIGRVKSGTILDPFMGSGTTGVACVQTGRRFVGVEIDEGYFQIARRRIEQAMLQTRMGL
jgi:site-specific DNA-methyltransferase (adenine-specific)